jgi:hypothetical protein
MNNADLPISYFLGPELADVPADVREKFLAV